MKTFHYIIATYSGKKNSIEHTNTFQDEDALQIQLQRLKLLFTQKYDLGIPNQIKQITIICPTPIGEIYENYYQKDKWLSICGVPIVYQQYIGENKHYSYDQWFQGLFKYSDDFDYHIFLEDDYSINPSCILFEKELIKIYNEKFPSNIGYLCTLTGYCNNTYHASISNGCMSKETVIKMKNTSIIDDFYQYRIHPQISFSVVIMLLDIKILDMSDYYDCPFYITNSKHIVYVQKNGEFNDTRNNKPFLFIPVQLVLL
jgi:hypothetical protein